MTLSRLDILNLEWPNSDRDLHIVTPPLVYLEKKYNIIYKTKSIFNAYLYLLIYRPKVLILSNFVGASINYNIVKLAYLSGIKVVSFISEGNIKANEVDIFLWGKNEHNFYLDKLLVWTGRSRNLFLNYYPELSLKISVVGSTGFDRYKLLNFQNKTSFLNDNKINYKKIIGIASWGFDHFFEESNKYDYNYYINLLGNYQVERHQNDLYKLQKIYKQLIEKNKDILFILRYHPGTIDFEKNEFYGLDKYDNVFISNKFKNNQYKISDLINISDLWIGYETTTALESWLLGKQTFLINPSGSDFIRENVYEGSPIVETAEEAQILIDEYFTTKTIKKFELLEKKRREIIKDVIEYGDGKNYVRAAKEIIKVYNQPDKEIKFTLKVYKEAFKQILKLILSKTIFQKRWPELNYKSNFAKKYQDMYDKVISDNI